MRRLRVKPQEFKGEVTAFMSLLFLLILSIVGAMIQSASIHVTKSMKRADTDLAMESIFAEYHPDLLKQYEIFTREGTAEGSISRRLAFYGAKNMEHSIEKIELLSDQSGAPFYRQVIRFMGGNVVAGDLPNDTDMEEEAQSVKADLEELLESEEHSLSTEDNPLAIVKQLQTLGILALVLQDSSQVSEKTILEETLASQRELQQGTGFEQGFPEPSITNKLLFATYLNQHFFHYLGDSQEHPLSYEAEYLLAGTSSDRENLKVVANKILKIRIGVNYTYLLTNPEKQAEAMTMAMGLSSLLFAPEAAEIVKQALLFAWAYGESIVDLRGLFAGKKVPVTKNDENWTLQLSNIAELLNQEYGAYTVQEEQGVTYQEYLHMLFLLEQETVLSMRALDLLELNLGIKVDECVTALQMKSSCKMQRNITDTFLTEYGYQ